MTTRRYPSATNVPERVKSRITGSPSTGIRRRAWYSCATVYSLMVWQAAWLCGYWHLPEGNPSPVAMGPQLATKVEVLLIFPVLDLGFAARSLAEDQHVQRHALSLDEVGHDAGDHHLLGAVQESHIAARHI